MYEGAHNPYEVLAVVDTDDRIVGKATRQEVHEKGLLHREVYVFLVTSKQNVLLQRRADNNLWTASCSGHFPLGQSYCFAAQREFEEELGIKIGARDFCRIAKEQYGKGTGNYRLAEIFTVTQDIPISDFKPSKAEVAEISYFSKEELLEKFLEQHENLLAHSTGTMLRRHILPKL